MKSVWLKGLSTEKNILAAFRYTDRSDIGFISISVAASNLYRIFLNGILIGYGPARAAHGYTRVDTYSVRRSEYGGGELVVTVEVYSAQVHNFYLIKEQPFFGCEILADDKLIADTSDFEAFRITEKIQKTRRYAFQRCFTEAYHLSSDPNDFRKGLNTAGIPWETEEVPMNSLIPRRLHYPDLDEVRPDLIRGGNFTLADPGTWTESGFAEELAGYEGYKTSELEEDVLSLAERIHAADEYNTDTVAWLLAADSYKVYDFKRTVTGFFRLDLKCTGPAEILITFDELIDARRTPDTEPARGIDPLRNNTVNAIKYSLSAEGIGNEFHLLTFEAVSARYVQISVISGTVIINDFSVVKYENSWAAGYGKGYADPELDDILQAAVNTYAQNAVDVPTDCPSRERAGWLCDSFFSSKAEKLFTGSNLVEHNFLENFVLAPHLKELPEQMIPMCYPCDHADGTFIPNWAMWYVLELEDYLARSGDRKMIDRSRDIVYGLVSYFDRFLNEYGLIENLDGWVFVEWSMCNTPDFIKGLNYPSNMLWADMLRAVSSLYDDKKLLERSLEIKSTIKRMAWNGQFFEDNAVRDENGRLVRTGHTTETGQYYPFYFGVATPEEFPELWNLLIGTFGPARDFSSVYPDVHFANVLVGFHLRFALLLRYRLYGKVIEECKKLFLPMARTTGTLWEHWSPYSSLNHAFEAVVAVYLDEAVRNLK